ncbi:GNAT family N-acetyltransferase [Vallitalea maricola]|uniref:GNAT family protein n=1 Tax=Vallitalea maricola TaxID=3074433 RepID=A0ACB5UQ41_9FIRM|nr:GNAT family protein [Vallitalea sp. AN17-2]
MFTYTVDKDIELRILETRHTEECFNLINSEREYLREWLPWVDNTKEIKVVKKYIESGLKQFSNNDGFNCGIWYKGEYAGVIGLIGINWGHKSTSIGYWLGSKFVGKGIMTKSCRVLIEYVFKELGLHRVEIRCAEENIKSRAIPERLGFTEEGKVRESEYLYDHYVNHIVYGILDKEWL